MEVKGGERGDVRQRLERTGQLEKEMYKWNKDKGEGQRDRNVRGGWEMGVECVQEANTDYTSCGYDPETLNCPRQEWLIGSYLLGRQI